jgi:hypothetical protein
VGKIRIPVDVKFFCAVTFSNYEEFEKVKKILEAAFGPIEIVSAVYDFNFTQYYFEEMGGNLKKQILGFEQLVSPDSLADKKILTNEIENKFSVKKKRRLNLDPGYLSAANAVLATTKNFDHRIYLGKGIYGDVHLRYRGRKFHFNSWTYPDYRDIIVIDFFARLRKSYMKEYEKMMRKRKMKVEE